MKKVFLLAAGLMMALTACQKEETPVSGTATSQTISVTVPQGIQTRATGDGDGSMVNRCILEIYRNGTLYGERKVTTVANGQATFSDLRLVAQQTYDFVFWADCADNGADKYYNTSNGLTAIEAITYAGNKEEFDAFFLCQKDYKVEASFNETGWVLKRPFGQLNIKTNDLGAIPADLQPDAVAVTFKNLPASFNALEGVTSETTQTEVTYTASILDATSGKLTVDYLWASEEEGTTLSDFTMTFLNDGQVICTNDAFTNIPIRRNYKTNVSGNLLTKTGTITVTIDPDFEEDSPIEKKIIEVAGPADVLQAIKDGATEIIVTEIPADAAAIEIPKIYATDNDTQISLTLPQTSNPVTIQYESAASGETGSQDAPANITVTANTTDKTTINTPESTVTLQGSFGEIDATTADNTLIVPEGVTVTKLNVVKGNVEIYGKVTEITFAEGAGIVTAYAAGDIETLTKAATLIGTGKCAEIILTADINLAQYTTSEIQIKNPLTLTINKDVTFTVSQYQIANYSELTIKSNGTITGPGYMINNYPNATLNIESGHFTTTGTQYDAPCIYNGDNSMQGVAICNIKDGYFESPDYAVMNVYNAQMTIDGGVFISTPGGKAAYAVSSYKSTLTVNSGKIYGVRTTGNATTTIKGGTIYNDEWYAVYNGFEGGVATTTIEGGYFSGHVKDVCVDSNAGPIVAKGGYFHDQTTPLAEGYRYQENIQTVDGITYNYEVVAQ